MSKRLIKLGIELHRVTRTCHKVHYVNFFSFFITSTIYVCYFLLVSVDAELFAFFSCPCVMARSIQPKKQIYPVVLCKHLFPIIYCPNLPFCFSKHFSLQSLLDQQFRRRFVPPDLPKFGYLCCEIVSNHRSKVFMSRGAIELLKSK